MSLQFNIKNILLFCFCMYSLQLLAIGGNCGDGSAVRWELDSQTGTLIISGHGRMRNYDGSGELDKPAPWQNKRVRIVIVNSGVKSIGKDAFFGCKDLEAVDIGTGVNHISSGAFAQCENLRSIRIPDNVVTMGKGVFLQCSKLSHVMLSGKLQVLRLATFMDCKSLETITLPEGLTTIEDLVFDGCRNLLTITIPASVTYIGGAVFRGCTSLTSIQVDLLNPNYTSFGGILYDKQQTTLIKYPANNKESSLFLPNSITTISYEALDKCIHLQTIVHRQPLDFSKSGVQPTTKIFHWTTSGKCGDNIYWAFNEDTGVLSLTGYGDMYDYLNEDFNNLPWRYFLYDIKSIILPEGLTSIGAQAFFNCKNIKSITIPDKVKTIGESAFQYCSDLEQISIPNSVTSIGKYAFDSDSSLVSITLSNNIAEIDTSLFGRCISLREISIPEQVKIIKACAFKECQSLESITFPNAVVYIGENAFIRCRSLTSITIPEGVSSMGKRVFQYCSNIKSITWNAIDCKTEYDENYVYPPFQDCENIESFYIGNNVKKIPAALCYGMTQLHQIEIPPSVEEIGHCAFKECTNLKSMYIPDGTKMDKHIFVNDSALISIRLPNDLTEIKSSLFMGCRSLSTINIPENIQKIEDRAFVDCASLESIYISRNVIKLSISDNAFDGCSSLKKIVLPEKIPLPSSLTMNREIIRIPVDLPDLHIVENSLYLSDANGNNTIEVDEPCYIHFKLCNKGKGDGKGCMVNITGQQDYSFIHVVPDTTIGDVAAFDTINVTIPIGTTHNAGTENVLITISVKDIQEVETNSAFITLHTSRFVKPSITIKSFELYSYSCIAAKAIPISVRMNIQNQSIGFAKDVKCEIQLPEGCLVTKGEIAHQWETLSPGENQNISFDFVPTKSASNSIEIQYLLMEKYGKYGENGAIPITFGKTPTYRITSSEDKSLSIAGNPKIKMLINTSVAILRPEWFNKYNNPQNVKSPFPYAAIKLEIKGTKEAIEIAKERLSLMMGGKHIVEAKDVKETNMIWFLVHCRNEYIDLDCGDGCEPINIRKERLEPNNVYHGIVDVNVL